MCTTRVAVFLLISTLAGCESSEMLTPAQREAVAAYVTETPPSPQHPLDAVVGRRSRLLGYDLETTRWRPGETREVTWYWEVLAPFPEGSALFTHLEDANAPRVLQQDGNGTLRWLYGPEHWRAGQYIRDVQALHLPDDWAAPAVDVYVGVAREGGRETVEGDTPHAGGRIHAARITTDSAPVGKQASVPRVRVPQTPRPPKLDGALDDPIWEAAPSTGPFVETIGGARAPVEATAKLLWDRRYLYVGVVVQDALLRASDTEHDAHLWEQDCVELMVDPGGKGEGYFEIQVSPRGVVFDTRYDRRRVPRPFGHVDWDSRVRVGVATRGNLGDRVADAGYTVEIAIPWQAFSSSEGERVAPSIGDEWRANLYVMDLGRDRQQAAAWSPVGTGDFHVPRRFGILAFEGTSEEMQGSNEPKPLPPGRMPGELRRGSGFDPGVRETMIEKRETRRRLEAAGGGH